MKSILLFTFIAVSCALAQNWQPNVTNARLETRAFSGDLSAQLQSASPVWFGYAEKAVPGEHGGECHCDLEGPWENQADRGPVHPEEPAAVAVLLRVSNDGVEKIQAHPISCQLDAGGMRLIWLTGVPPEMSLAWLEKRARTDAQPDGAILAISMHESVEADVILERLTRPEEPEKTRDRAIFWLGVSRGARGVEILEKILANDSNPQIRDKAIFALIVSRQPEAQSDLLRAAKDDPSPHVRGQALFWLAQKAGERAAATIENAIRDDPDTEVKKRAVFALSQMPPDEGVPRLIEVARNQRNPEVRKQAFFWLGQSRDPRALQFIEKVLEAPAR
jgi:hypothetical protein